jgi:hypothetical protein
MELLPAHYTSPKHLATRLETRLLLINSALHAQVALERLAIVEKQRQSAVEELQALHTGPRVGSPVMAPGPGRSALQAALDKARADSEAAQFRANEAEAALAALTIEQQSRQVGVLRLP